MQEIDDDDNDNNSNNNNFHFYPAFLSGTQGVLHNIVKTTQSQDRDEQHCSWLKEKLDKNANKQFFKKLSKATKQSMQAKNCERQENHLKFYIVSVCGTLLRS